MNIKLIKRSIRFFYQRLTRGFDDSETWGMDYTFAAFILPRLRRFKEVNIGYPPELTFKLWNEYIDNMILAFEFYSSEKRFDDVKSDFDKAQVGLDLFAKYYSHLWW